MPSDQPLSHAAEQVRRFDRERFTAALFAPPPGRERLMALYAFNLELARVRDSVREPMAGLIRLQWWRDVLAGSRGDEAARHPVAAPLLAVMTQCDIPASALEMTLAGREKDLEAIPFATDTDRANYAFETAGLLHEVAVMALGARDEASRAAARFVGQAWASIGLLRALPYHLSTGWVTLPADLLAHAGITPEDVLGGRASKDALAQVAREIGRRARFNLAQARKHRVPRRAVPALLPATIAAAHLRALERAEWDLFDTRVALPRTSPARLAVKALVGRF